MGRLKSYVALRTFAGIDPMRDVSSKQDKRLAIAA